MTPPVQPLSAETMAWSIRNGLYPLVQGSTNRKLYREILLLLRAHAALAPRHIHEEINATKPGHIKCSKHASLFCRDLYGAGALVVGKGRNPKTMYSIREENEQRIFQCVVYFDAVDQLLGV